jgi:hypothetical protein
LNYKKIGFAYVKQHEITAIYLTTNNNSDGNKYPYCLNITLCNGHNFVACGCSQEFFENLGRELQNKNENPYDKQYE